LNLQRKLSLLGVQQPVEQRFKILNRIAELIDEHLDELALAETNDNGKPFG
jgi:acyl-CoA reductase-like NAD-dependent aldehyde dehydrogenase